MYSIKMRYEYVMRGWTCSSHVENKKFMQNFAWKTNRASPFITYLVRSLVREFVSESRAEIRLVRK
jgi:hypothetical protein